METVDPAERENTTQETGDEESHVGYEESPTVMPEQEAEDEPREPSPPAGPGPGGG